MWAFHGVPIRSVSLVTLIAITAFHPVPAGGSQPRAALRTGSTATIGTSVETGALRWSAPAPIANCGFRLFLAYGTYLPSIAVANRRVIVPMHCGIAVYGPA